MALCANEDKNTCEKLKFKISVYFVTCVHRSILNIVSTKLYHENINKQKDTDAFDLQNIKKSGTVFLCFDSFYFSRYHCHLFVFCHYIW